MKLAHKDGRAASVKFVEAAKARKGKKGRCRLNPDEIFIENSKRVKNAKKYLIIERGLKCEKCAGSEWLGKPMPIELHHKNGEETDCRRENLELLCPNCHTFTPNYTSKNSEEYKERTKRAKHVFEAAILIAPGCDGTPQIFESDLNEEEQKEWRKIVGRL
jgi:hypothetical protein